VNQTFEASVVDVPNPFFAAVAQCAFCAVAIWHPIKIMKKIRVIRG
jgi:hypothetical protein